MSLYRCRYLDRTFNVFEIQGVACGVAPTFAVRRIIVNKRRPC
jgi:hypothetical protein